jgi:hypothetical protein
MNQGGRVWVGDSCKHEEINGTLDLKSGDELSTCPLSNTPLTGAFFAHHISSCTTYVEQTYKVRSQT